MSLLTPFSAGLIILLRVRNLGFRCLVDDVGAEAVMTH
jgi:hypothetical protein